MDILRNILLVLHFVGLAALFGGVIAQVPAIKKGAGVINAAIMHGGLLQLVSGLGLVALIEAADLGDLNHMKIGVKLVVMIAIVVLSLMNRKKASVSGGILFTIAGLAFLNICLAVFW